MKWGSLVLCVWMLFVAYWLRDSPVGNFIAVFLAGMWANEFEQSGRSKPESEVTK